MTAYVTVRQDGTFHVQCDECDWGVGIAAPGDGWRVTVAGNVRDSHDAERHDIPTGPLRTETHEVDVKWFHPKGYPLHWAAGVRRLTASRTSPRCGHRHAFEEDAERCGRRQLAALVIAR